MKKRFGFSFLFFRVCIWVGFILFFVNCKTCKSYYDAEYYSQVEAIKTQANYLLGKTNEPYTAHRVQAEKFLNDLDLVYTHAVGKKDKNAAEVWSLLRNELIKPVFERWRIDGRLDPMFSNELKKQFNAQLELILREERFKPNKGSKIKNNEELENLPLFPWEPPFSSAHYNLTNYFRSCKYYSEVWSTLQQALNDCGYPNTCYKVPGGFAVVTQLEQTSEDGTPYYPERWLVDKSNLMEIHNLREYFGALLFGKIGYSRTITFIITNKRFKQRNSLIKESNARKWKNNGVLNVTPATFGTERFTEKHTVTALIYEFQVKKDDQAIQFCLPSRHSGDVHIEKSGLLKCLSQQLHK